jgi:hypothetical protein
LTCRKLGVRLANKYESLAGRRDLFKKTIPLLIVALIFSLLIGCNGTVKTETSIDLVPQRADMVGKLYIGQILGDSELIELYNSLPKDSDTPQTFENAIDMVIEEAGFNLRDFEEIVIFGQTSSGSGDTDYFGAIVEGSFNEGDLIAAIEEAAEVDLNPFDYKGYEVYTDQEQQAAIVFLDAETFVIGTVELVMDVIDVKEGDEAALGGEVLDRYHELGGVLIGAAASIAPELTESALGTASDYLPMQLDLSAIADIETATLTLDKENQSLALDMEICFSDTRSAKAVKALISLAKAMTDVYEIPDEIPGGIPIPEIGKELIPELLDRLDTEVVDSCLTISLHMTLSEIEDLMAEQEAV